MIAGNSSQGFSINGCDIHTFMIDNGMGVSVVSNYEIKRIDSDYFVEE